MGIEKAMIARAEPQIVHKMINELIRNEVIKGCSPGISKFPVALEPSFFPLWNLQKNNPPESQQCFTPEIQIDPKDMMRVRFWISPEQKFDWKHSEIFLKQLHSLSFKASFEIIGNNSGIMIGLLCHQIDYPMINAAFIGTFEHCEISILNSNPLMDLPFEAWEKINFYDFFPSPPYSHLLTSPTEFQLSPFQMLIINMSMIKSPAIGLYQVLFESVSPKHNWHRNVEILSDYEYVSKLQGGFHSLQRYAQQSPSGDLHNMANEIETKANNDKPFYTMVLRFALLGAKNNNQKILESISTIQGLFQHGGRPLLCLTENEYKQIMPPEKIREMFLNGQTYRPGFLVNSWELTGPVHIPPITINEYRKINMEGLEILSADNPELNHGTFIGTCLHLGKERRVCIPEKPRKTHTHIIGRSGFGKTTALEQIILNDIHNGDGVAVLDPHGDLIERLLCQIPEKDVARTIYLNPGIPDQVPIWNPLRRIDGLDIGRTADDIIRAIQGFVTTNSWGDRMEHILRTIVFSIMHLPDGNFLDIYNLLQNKSDESKTISEEILKVVDNETVRSFWLHDYDKYKKDDFGPPRNKLSKLLISKSISLMLSQPDSKFNFRNIMDQGMILLVDLSKIGSMVREVLGCFILSLLHLTAISRSNIPESQRKQFHIHCDEAHRFMTDSIEDIIAETRKYNVSLTICHQFFKQFPPQKIEALSSVGSTIIFNVNKQDANYQIKGLQNKVDVNDLISLECGQAIVRIGTDILRIKIQPPSELKSTGFRDRIIQESLQKYYQPAHEVQKRVRNRGHRWNKRFTSLNDDHHCVPEDDNRDYQYDEFD